MTESIEDGGPAAAGALPVHLRARSFTCMQRNDLVQGHATKFKATSARTDETDNMRRVADDQSMARYRAGDNRTGTDKREPPDSHVRQYDRSGSNRTAVTQKGRADLPIGGRL
jgi:hypothetical protein